MTTEYAFPQQPAAELTEKIERISRELPGFQHEQRQKQMAQLILDTKPDIVVEIGVYGGRSLIPMALALKANRRGMIFGIDPWDEAIHHEGLGADLEDGDLKQNDLNNARLMCGMAMDEYAVNEYVNLIPCRSSELKMDAFWRDKIDILHVDGAHGDDPAYNDVLIYGTSVRSGGYIWMDDSNWKSVQKALGLVETFADCVSDQGTYRLYHVR